MAFALDAPAQTAIKKIALLVKNETGIDPAAFGKLDFYEPVLKTRGVLKRAHVARCCRQRQRGWNYKNGFVVIVSDFYRGPVFLKRQPSAAPLKNFFACHAPQKPTPKATLRGDVA